LGNYENKYCNVLKYGTIFMYVYACAGFHVDINTRGGATLMSVFDYTHCRRRNDLVLAEKEKMKTFIAIEDEIKVLILFYHHNQFNKISRLDEVVTFLSLNIFEKYI
jgi:hypothetical protein